jgi:MoaA/NifB/PqqE/SkfB family radical SAM enzyme
MGMIAGKGLQSGSTAAPFYPVVPPISLELTSRCNLKCPYCANPTLTRPTGYIDWELFEKLVDECSRERFNLATLHGVGEPLLWKRLEEAVSLIKSRDAGLGSFGTNGTLLYPDRVRSLLDAGLDFIYVSIDTLDPEIYKNTRGGSLSKVIQNIKDMIAIAPSDFRIKIALMDHKDHRVTQERVDQFYEVFGHHPNVSTNLVVNTLHPGSPADYRVDQSKSDTCLSPRNYMFVAYDGRVAVCCADQDVKGVMCNLKQQTIREVWYSPANQRAFRNIALGVGTCPDVCVKQCILNKPTHDDTNIHPAFLKDFGEVREIFLSLIEDGEVEQAAPYLSALLARDVDESILADIEWLGESGREMANMVRAQTAHPFAIDPSRVIESALAGV